MTNFRLFLFKNCAKSLTVPITNIYNKSLQEGIFPSIWKAALIVPVFKDGDRRDVTKYRPISKLSVLSKIFESLVCPYINWHMKSILTPKQREFFKHISTLSNLVTYVDFLTSHVDRNLQVDLIYTDFSKAYFDLVECRS